MSRFNLRQRIVVVIGLGFGLGFFGLWATTRGAAGLAYGWVGYAPLSRAIFAPVDGGLHPWVRLIIWLALTVVWTVASLLLLRTSSEP